MAEAKKIDRYLNLCGLLCPNPSMITAKKLEDMGTGEILEVICNDKTVKISIPALCHRENYEILEEREGKGLIRFIIKK